VPIAELRTKSRRYTVAHSVFNAGVLIEAALRANH
jgi:hypothetical protein